MDLSELNDEIRKNEEELKDLDKNDDIIKDLERYNGVDKLLWYMKFAESVNERNKNYKEESYESKIPSLDKMVNGFKPGQLVIVSGPTGQGKTALFMHLIRSFDEQKLVSNLISYEINPMELKHRFGEEVPHFVLPSKNVESNILWLKSRILEGVAKFDARIVFVDHLHYLIDLQTLMKINNTSIVIGALLRDLKKFSEEYRVTIFLASHLKMTKLEESPKLDDLRDSSFIGQESDFVMMIARAMEKDKTTPDGYRYTSNANLYLCKNRWNGEVGHIKLSFDSKTSRYTELTNIYGQTS